MDDAELTGLYTRYGHLVHRRCVALLRHPADAEDALQETFLRVRRYGAKKPTTNVLGWLYAIASNVCFDLGAKRGRETPHHEEDVASLDVRSEGSSDDGDRRAVIGALLRQVDGTTREMGVLHYVDGYTQEEVAAHTGYSRRTVGKKLQAFEERVKSLWRRAVDAGGREP